MSLDTMNERTRIEKDIIMFNENLQKTEKKIQTDREKKILEFASQYYEDSKYYLKHEDFFTSFGCINYAHGLVDAIFKFP